MLAVEIYSLDIAFHFICFYQIKARTFLNLISYFRNKQELIWYQKFTFCKSFISKTQCIKNNFYLYSITRNKFASSQN